MRKVAILLTCLLTSSSVIDVANGQTEQAAKPLPPNWRELIARHMLQKYDLSNIREAGITTPAYVWVNLPQWYSWAVCVATMHDGNRYRLFTLSFTKDGQVSDQGETSVRPGGRFGLPGLKVSVGRTKLSMRPHCVEAPTSPFPEIVRAKPLS